MSVGELRYREITDVREDLFADWLDALHVSFPPDELMLPGFFLRLLKAKAQGDEAAGEHHLTAVLDAEGEPIACLMAQLVREIKVCYLWYLCVEEEKRSQGIGSAVYKEMVRRAREEMPDLRAVVYEIDRPDEAKSEEERVAALRRIAFYKRHSGRIAANIAYYQNVGRKDQPPKRMYLCLHPLAPIEDEEASAIFERLFGGEMEPADAIEWK